MNDSNMFMAQLTSASEVTALTADVYLLNLTNEN